MTGEEIVEFSRAVKDVFLIDDLVELLSSMKKEFTDYVSADKPYPNKVFQLIAAANAQGWIAQLVVKVLQERGDTGIMRSFLANHPHFDPAKSQIAEDPCETLFVFGGKCFIGRSDFRKYLKKMSNPTGRKVLVVTSADRKVGKTYSKDLINYLSTSKSEPFVPIDLDVDEYDPGRLAQRIAHELGIPEEMQEQGKQQATRWNQELVQSLIPDGLNLDPRVWWIVLDGFRERVTSEAMQDFIAQLAGRIQQTPRFRLILINYEYPLPLGVQAWAWKENVCRIAKDDVESFLTKLHKINRGAMPTDEELTDYVSVFYEQVAKYSTKYPEYANDQLLLNMAMTDVVDGFGG